MSTGSTTSRRSPRLPTPLRRLGQFRRPAQSRAGGSGSERRSSRRISNAVWRSMVGRSWHRGCPVGRSGLRLLSINYWGFDGYRRRGQMVLGAGRGQSGGRGVARHVQPASADQADVPRGPVRLEQEAAGRRRLQVHARRQHLGLQLPQRRQPARGPFPARNWSRRGHQHLGEPLPVCDRVGPELVVGLTQPPEDRVAVELAPRRTNLAVARFPVDLRHWRQPARRRTQDTSFRQLRRLTAAAH